MSFERSSERGICFQHADKPGSCDYGDKCKYVHLDKSKPADFERLFEYFKSMASKRTASPGLHSLSADFEPVASTRSSAEYDQDAKED